LQDSIEDAWMVLKAIQEILEDFLTRRLSRHEPEPPESLRTQIDRLRELEERSPSIIPAAERWDKRRH
jgi:hypothetical protein